uniref:Uncharacterized protein n=1 Tax=Rhizophagus irregularis (strain DAOM 181602 / DAOM 197198 / MUCL 43194) TaxID=747089 RepID=U9TUM1_RHIID
MLKLMLKPKLTICLICFKLQVSSFKLYAFSFSHGRENDGHGTTGLDGLTGHAVIGNAGQDEGLTRMSAEMHRTYMTSRSPVAIRLPDTKGNPSVPKWILDFTSGDVFQYLDL